jgi:predicted DNA-binding ribbon-helix-helix protein
LALHSTVASTINKEPGDDQYDGKAFWRGLKDVAASRRVTLSDLVAGIHSERQHGNLSSAIRLFVLNHYQANMALPDRSFPAPDQPHAAH